MVVRNWTFTVERAFQETTRDHHELASPAHSLNPKANLTSSTPPKLSRSHHVPIPPFTPRGPKHRTSETPRLALPERGGEQRARSRIQLRRFRDVTNTGNPSGPTPESCSRHGKERAGLLVVTL